MNALENYIKEILSVEDVTQSFYEYVYGRKPKEDDEKVYRVKVLSDCCGNVRESVHEWTESELADVKEKGYYWA